MSIFIGIFIIALATGVFFFAGLHYSTGKMIRSRYAAAWAAGSFLIRTAVTLGIFYWLSAGSASRLLVCVAGFVAAKWLVVRLKGRSNFAGRSNYKGGKHATQP